MTDEKENIEKESKIDNTESEILDFEEGLEVEDLQVEVPEMTVNLNKEKECLIGDGMLLEIYDEILANCRADREQANDILMNFFNMVMNDGESSSASKEAIVNLMKIKSDISDKMAKIADLETRIKLKDNDTYPRYLAAQQNNKIVFDNKRNFLKRVEKMRNKDDKQK